VNDAEPETEWSAFTRRFFSSPNELAAVGDEAVESAVAEAEAAWLATPPAPFFLPVNVSGWTYWYAVCPIGSRPADRDLIRAHVGSWIDGQPVPADLTCRWTRPSER
jgi:hypothetical protein